MNREAIASLALDVFMPAIETADDAELVLEIVAAILTDTGVVWGLPTSALFAQVMTGPDGKYLELGPSVGVLEEILNLSPQIDAWAQAEGCRYIDVVYSRDGWKRALKPLGYQLADGGMRKTLPWG